MSGTQRGFLFPGDLGSDTFHVEVDGEPSPVSAIPSVQSADYPRIANDFKVYKSATWIDPPRLMGVHYAQFEAVGPVSVTITCPNPVKSVTVHPKRRMIEPKIDGNRITLKLEDVKPRYTILDIDEYPMLLIVIDEPIKNPVDRNDPHLIDIASYVTDSDSVAKRTEGFEKAIHAASKAKKTLYVPAGVYFVDAIKIHNIDGLNIYFEPGSLIRTEVSPVGQNIHTHGLWLQDSKNIHISGRGCLDHQGLGNFAHGRNAYNHGLISYYVSNDLCPWLSESPVFMMRCQNVTMEGFMVRNGRNMNYNIRRCDNVTLRNCRIVTPPASCPEYTDGYHTNSCQNVLIENCLAYCNDDCFASGHYTHWDNRDSANHTIKGLVGWNVRANGIRLGFHTYYNLGDYHFENCDLAGFTWRALMVHPLHDAEEANRYQRYGTISMVDCGLDSAREGSLLVEIDTARIKELAFKGCVFDKKGALSVKGHDPNGQVDRLTIDNVTIAGVRLSDKSDPAIQIEQVGQTTVT